MKKIHSTFMMLIILASGLTANNAVIKKSYVLNAKDTVHVTVFDEPNLEVQVPVNARGYIKLPLIGNVMVRDMTIHQAERVIEQAYIDGEYLRNPEVTLVVMEYAPRVVSVLGQVNKSGQIQLPKQVTEMSIIEVIGQAGGFKGIADSSDVRVTRILSNGKEEVFSVDVQRMIAGEEKPSKKAEVFMVIPGDVIFIPERFF